MILKLLVDEDFPLPVIQGLIEAGYDVLSIAKVSPGINDRAVLALARETGRSLLTFDVDSGDLVFFSWSRTTCGYPVFPLAPHYFG